MTASPATLLGKDNRDKPAVAWKQRLATAVADSFLLRKGKKIHLENLNDPYLGNNLWLKFLANLYLILADYGTGSFPPKRLLREESYARERAQIQSVKIKDTVPLIDEIMSKPWWDKRLFPQHSRELIRMIESIESSGVRVPARILELGCGMGWMSEILALRGYDVTGTSISEFEIEHAKLRIDSLKAKKLNRSLQFIATPMEEVHRHVCNASYDAAFCYEALHHVYDWREAFESADKCLRPGGWLFLFGEPSALHTYICWRTSKIWRTEEIGFRGKELRRQLEKMGYRNIRIQRPVWGEGTRALLKRCLPFTIAAGSLVSRSYWIRAQRPG